MAKRLKRDIDTEPESDRDSDLDVRSVEDHATVCLTTRVPADLAHLIRERTREDGSNVSTFLRSACIDALETDEGALPFLGDASVKNPPRSATGDDSS